MSVRWSPRTAAGELIGYLVQTEEGRTLWGIAPDGSAPPRKLFEGLTSFDWYLDCRRIVCTLDEGRAEELVAVDLETKKEQPLWRAPHAEIDVAPDGRSVMFCRGLGHLNMGLATLLGPLGAGGMGDCSGRPTYMSSEQARGKLVDRRTGIWAFGCGSSSA